MPTVIVGNLTALQAAIDAALPGDTIQLQDGVYNVTSQTVISVLNKAGTSVAPITIQSATVGGAQLTSSGSGRGAFLIQNSAWITLKGFKHLWKVVPAGTLPAASGHDYALVVHGGKNLVITRNHFEPVEPSPEVNGSYPYWLWMDSFDNPSGNQLCADVEISFNTFQNKTNTGSFVVTEGDKGSAKQAVQRVWIHHNYFKTILNESLNSAPNGTGNKEAIRLGSSSLGASLGNCLIENNLFEQCSGEDEHTSIKCGGNILRYNTFRECYGNLVCRHGNGNSIEGNIFLGGNVIGTGGVRLAGDNHKVFNNYFENLDGRNFTSPNSNSNAKGPLVLQAGDVDENGNNGVNGCDAAEVTFNTFVNCRRGIKIGFFGSSGSPGFIVGHNTKCKFDYNVVYMPGSSDDVAVVLTGSQTADAQVTFTGNIWLAQTYNGAPVPPDNSSGNRRVDPLFSLPINLGRLQATSPALNTVGPGVYTYVTQDLEGRVRVLSTRDAGCQELNAGATLRAPLQPADVGPFAQSTEAAPGGTGIVF